MTATVPNFGSGDTAVQELVLFRALERDWLNDKVKIVLIAPPNDGVIVEGENIPLSEIVWQMTNRGIQRPIRLGYGKANNLLIYQVLPWTSLQQIGTTA